MDASNFNFRQLTLAREYRGYSQSDLCKKVPGLSQPNLSKFEKGFGGISPLVLTQLINVLGFPESFFYERITNSVESAHFRKRSGITQKQRAYIDNNIKLIGFTVDKMTESIEWPEYRFTSFDVEDYSPEYIAEYLRKKVGLKPDEPVADIHQLLESNGILVVEFEFECAGFDGVSLITDSGVPLIIVERKMPNDRKRFTLAHELGHMVMHAMCNDPISIHRDREDEANRFASEFLMPASRIRNSLFGLKLNDMGKLKQYWLTSMASILRRAYALECIDKNRWSYLNIELSRRGWKTNEPIEVYIDSPSYFKKAYKLHKEDMEYTDVDFINGFSLPADIIRSFFHDPGQIRVLRNLNANRIQIA